MASLVEKEMSADQTYLSCLNELVHCIDCLKKAGYITEPLTDQELAKRNRCSLCRDRLTKKFRRAPQPGAKKNGPKQPSQMVVGQETAPKNNAVPASSIGVLKANLDAMALQVEGDKEKEKKKEEPKPKCFYHTGRFERGRFECCNASPWEKGCQEALEHTGKYYDDKALRDRFNFVRTPPRTPGNDRLPNGKKLPRPRVAVALDCEMGVAWDRESELIRITMIDYFTGEKLIDSLVMPSIKLLNLNTRYSGVRWADLKRASIARQAINDYHNARREVWKHVDPNTIVVLHGGSSDLGVLRWIHPRIVDSGIVEATRKGGSDDSKALKELADKILGRKIQKGRDGHDSLEDAIATRDLVHFYVTKKMEEKAADLISL